MSNPDAFPFDLPISKESLERLHRFARTAARRMSLPADPLLAEYVREIGEGRSRPRDLLLSGHYDDAIGPVLRRIVKEYARMDSNERASHLEEGEARISEILAEQPEDHGR